MTCSGRPTDKPVFFPSPEVWRHGTNPKGIEASDSLGETSGPRNWNGVGAISDCATTCPSSRIYDNSRVRYVVFIPCKINGKLEVVRNSLKRKLTLQQDARISLSWYTALEVKNYSARILARDPD